MTGRPRSVGQSRAAAIVPARRSSVTSAPRGLHIAQPPKVFAIARKAHNFNMAQGSSGLVDYASSSTSTEEENRSDFQWFPEEPRSPVPSEPVCLVTSSCSDNTCTDASLRPDCPTSGSEESDPQPHQSATKAVLADGPPPEEVLTVNSSTEEEAQGRETPGATAEQPQSSDDTQSPTDAGGMSDSDTSNATSPPSALLVDSSSQDEKPPAKLARLQIPRRGAQGRGAYALQRDQLTPELEDMLARSRAFFTKPHSLQRPGGPVTKSTYSKAEERIMCKYRSSFRCCLGSLHSCRRRHVRTGRFPSSRFLSWPGPARDSFNLSIVALYVGFLQKWWGERSR